MHSDVLPETSPVVVQIQTEAAGLSAPEVESLVTVPLEKNLLEGVMGVTDVTSDSIPGLSQISLQPPGRRLRVVGGPGRRAMRRGHTCVELDEAGKISRLTAIYDSSLLSCSAYQSLAGLAAEAPLS
jgi:hypothetical protein